MINYNHKSYPYRKDIRRLARKWADSLDDHSVFCAILGHRIQTEGIPFEKLKYHCALREVTKCVDAGLLPDSDAINGTLLSPDSAMNELGMQMVIGLREERLKLQENEYNSQNKINKVF